MLEVPQCYKRGCKHFLGVWQPDGTELTERVICKAFPKRIPNEIAYGEDRHETVRDDQEGDYVFEAK